MSADPFDGLGPALRDLRTDRRFTQAELAERAGVSKSMLSLYERDEQRPHLDTLGKLLDALGVSLGQLAARLERQALRDEALGAGDGRRPQGGHQLHSLLDGVQGAAEDAGEPELAAGLSHLRILHAVGWAAHGVVALGHLVEKVRDRLGRVEPGGEPWCGRRSSPIELGAVDAPSTETARRSGQNTPPGLAKQGDRFHA